MDPVPILPHPQPRLLGASKFLGRRKDFHHFGDVSTSNVNVLSTCSGGTRARQVKWPGWKIHRPGSSPGSALPSPAYCFASVIVWTENKNVTISDRFICFILTVKRRWRPVFWLRQLKKVRQHFLRNKSAPGWPGWRIFWPRNDLAPLLRWRRHCQHSRPSLSGLFLSVRSWLSTRVQLLTWLRDDWLTDLLLTCFAYLLIYFHAVSFFPPFVDATLTASRERYHMLDKHDNFLDSISGKINKTICR